MSETLSPRNEAELTDAVAAALADGRKLAVEGRGSKRGYGRPVAADAVLSTAGLSGITYYDPGELVMEAAAGTPLAEIEAELGANGQRLAFEPGDLGALYGAPGNASIGGTFACNVSGPRRPFAGAARDHLLGLRAVSGRGEVFAAGGRVVKNVTGYDMGKLLTGSLGTLAVLSRVTFKVLPAPAAERTVLLFADGPSDGLGALQLAAAQPCDISAGAHVGRQAAARSSVGYVAGAGTPVTAMRLEGEHTAVTERCAQLRGALSAIAPTEELHTSNSRAFWREVRNGDLLPSAAPGEMLWRMTLPPAGAAATLGRLAAVCDGDLLVDWLGGLVWFAAAPANDGTADDLSARVRTAAAQGEGHAVLVRAPDDVRARVAVFGEPDPALMALTRRIKHNFDPRGILNPGRMYAGM